jgi:proteic killer suppression protein
MVIRSFQDQEVEAFFKKGKMPQKRGWASIRAVVRRKLDMLHYAKELDDLRSPPGNRLESLSGNLQGCYSIRINDQWRIVFKWDSQPYNVRVVDYH